MARQWQTPTYGFFFLMLSNDFFSTTGSQLPMASDVVWLSRRLQMPKDRVKIVWSCIQISGVARKKPLILCEYTWDDYWLQRSGPWGVKVWVNRPVVIVYIGSASHMWVHSESTARAVNHKISGRFVLFKNLITRFGSCSAFVNFGVHGAIVL